MRDIDIIQELAGGARIIDSGGGQFVLERFIAEIPSSAVSRLNDQGFLVGPNSFRLSDAGRLAYIKSTDEFGEGKLISSAGTPVDNRPLEVTRVDVIGGFPYADPNCKGCGMPLLIENAWMTDGCPCNTPLGVNSMNETRWRLLMELQQRQSRALEACGAAVKRAFASSPVSPPSSWDGRFDDPKYERSVKDCSRPSPLAPELDRGGEKKLR